MQQLWSLGVKWDECIAPEVNAKWKEWLNVLPQIKNVRVPRCYHRMFLSKVMVELHIFADASERAMAAVAYARVEYQHELTVRFVFAKTRCAPLKYMSIPRLELQAAVIAVRLKEVVVKEHDIKFEKICYWTDSMTVMNWIRSDSRQYKQFVANRLGEILESSCASEWNWLPSAENVADEGTRANLSSFQPNGRWLKGPEFLQQCRQNWPKQPQRFLEQSEARVERKTGGYVMLAREKEAGLLVFERFSNYCRLKRSVAWVLRFVANIRRPSRGDSVKTCLDADEIDRAEKLLCRLVQREAFAGECALLLKQQPIGKKSSIVTLNPYLDEMGVMRLSGRIEKAPFMSADEKRLIILPKEHAVTGLIVDYYHRKLRHINKETVICEIRRKFWVSSLRVLVKRAEANCNFCKVRRAMPSPPLMGLLPVDRVTPYVRPFTYAGVDFFGPVVVTIRRQKEKRWVALFTCLTTRAVHLELASDLSSSACLLCIRNFINRRGVPVQIRSDNGTNFVGLAKELKGVTDFVDHGALKESLSNLGIRWKFNCPANPSEGGAWERLVQSVKKVLTIVLKESAPRLETLISVLIEAENIVNSRPLTHLPVSSVDAEPLTPNHFLLHCANSTQTPGSGNIEAISLRKQWRIAQTLKNGFWKRWIQEYLPELTRRSKWCQSTQPVRVGDLVLICESSAPRSEWKRGRVEKLYVGPDGTARSADVRTAQTTLKRPTSKLAKIDIVKNEE